MTAKQLDRSKPYGTVVGASNGAMFYQDGMEFRADGTPCSAAPAPAPVASAEPDTKDVVEPEPAPEPTQDVRAELEAMHPSKIKKLVEMRGLEPVKGPGSTAKNIELLLANDSD